MSEDEELKPIFRIAGEAQECKKHSGIRAEMDDLKESDRDQWTAVNGLQTSKASSSQMKWVVGIFLIIAMATVAFLWKAQLSGTDTIVKKIEVMEEKNNTKRDETNNKLDTLKDKFNELRWSVDEHLRKNGK